MYFRNTYLDKSGQPVHPAGIWMTKIDIAKVSINQSRILKTPKTIIAVCIL